MHRRHHCLTNAIALTLAFTAGAAPAAFADPAPLAQAEATIASSHPSAPAGPNPDQQIAARAANTGPCSEICSGGSYANPTRSSSAPTTIAPVRSDGGFHWGDAGIGAGATFVLVAIGLAGAGAATKGRKRRPLDPRTTATNDPAPNWPSTAV